MATSHRETAERDPAYPDPVSLNAALTVESTSLAAYAAMVALVNAGGRLPLMKLSLRTGLSYWAMRNHVRRTPYFDYDFNSSAKITVTITEEGVEKLQKIRQRIQFFLAEQGT